MGRISKRPKINSLTQFYDKDDHEVEPDDPNAYWLLRCTYDENNQLIESMWAHKVDKSEEKESDAQERMGR